MEYTSIHLIVGLYSYAGVCTVAAGLVAIVSECGGIYMQQVCRQWQQGADDVWPGSTEISTWVVNMDDLAATGHSQTRPPGWVQRHCWLMYFTVGCNLCTVSSRCSLTFTAIYHYNIVCISVFVSVYFWRSVHLLIYVTCLFICLFGLLLFSDKLAYFLYILPVCLPVCSATHNHLHIACDAVFHIWRTHSFYTLPTVWTVR